MRSIVIVLLLCAVGAVGFAGGVKLFPGAQFDPKIWTTLERFDVRTLSKESALAAHVGRLVEVRFQFRSRDIRHLKPNWYQSAIWQSAPEGKRGFVSVPVMIAAADVKAFAAFTTDPHSTAELKIYGQVLDDFSSNYVFVRVIGTNTVVDSHGYTNVTW
jgi:hypothetical protein